MGVATHRPHRKRCFANTATELREGSLSAAREKGLVRMEGKEYVVQDGDVILFRFNV